MGKAIVIDGEPRPARPVTLGFRCPYTGYLSSVAWDKVRIVVSSNDTLGEYVTIAHPCGHCRHSEHAVAIVRQEGFGRCSA